MKRAKTTMNSDAEVALRTTNKAELDLFTRPVEQNVILAAKDFEYGPDWALTQDGPIQFTLPVNREYFTDLSNCYLKVQLQVFKSDGSVLDEPDEQKVSLFHALFVKND